MDGLFKWPKLDVVCLGSWPNTIMLALINLKASMTTWAGNKNNSRSWQTLSDFKGSSGPNPHLSLDTLNGIDHHRDSALRQRLEALLRVDVHAWQPAAEARVTVVPSHHHLRSGDKQRDFVKDSVQTTSNKTVKQQKCFKRFLQRFYLPVCFSMSNILAWKTGSTASTLTPCQNKNI